MNVSALIRNQHQILERKCSLLYYKKICYHGSHVHNPHTTISNEEICLQYLLVILKHSLHNYQKILNKLNKYRAIYLTYTNIQKHTIVCPPSRGALSLSISREMFPRYLHSSCLMTAHMGFVGTIAHLQRVKQSLDIYTYKNVDTNLSPLTHRLITIH